VARSSPIPEEIDAVMRMKVGVSRKEATDRDGSVGATCEIEIELPGGTSDHEVLRIRDHWLDFCETTVDEELDRLRGGSSASDSGTPPAPAVRPKAAPPQAPHRDYRAPSPTRGHRDAEGDDGDRYDDRLAPADGRQLLGWAAKQVPDAKGLVISFGKKKGYPPKIVDWDDEQVRAAYRYARGRQGR
jgi:hypothetical protein